MPWLSGTYSRTDGVRTGSTVWQQAQAAGIGIESTAQDVHDQDIATALNLCLCKDGSNAATSDLSMGGNHLRHLAPATAPDDAMRLDQFFPSGTSLLFPGAIPVGWTISTAHNDMTLRLSNAVGGTTGGTVAFSTVFGSHTVSGTVGDHTLTVGEMPIHNHSVTDPGHAHPMAHQNMNFVGGSNAEHPKSDGELLTGGAYTGISIGNAGGGAAHGHSWTASAIDFSIQYLNVVVATKD
jgi:microcystin-dependent protein